ncbi:hypothetical protein BJX61DRAFT_122191 [Aspergillus egyptiacus]|nr:hypothetical protein BJX61DRAFT_122191 [Aspergillus egyptiacus]
MSLNTITSGVGAPVSQTTSNVQNTVNETAKPISQTVSDTTDDLPGTFPNEEQPTNQQNRVTIPSIAELWADFLTWVKTFVPRGVDIFEAAVRRFMLWLIPPERQAKMYKAAMEHPIAATFVMAQLLCCGIPLVLFIAGTMLFAGVAVVAWVILSCLILGPIILVASLMGVSLWGWGWFVFGLVRWLDRLVLGGVMERYWMAQIRKEEQQEEANRDMNRGEETQKRENEKDKKQGQ